MALTSTFLTHLEQAREARIAALVAAGALGDARRLRNCGRPMFMKDGRLIAPPCRRRECPVCAATVLSPAYSRKLRERARKMTNPISLRFSLASRGEHDLADTIAGLRRALSKLRRRRSLVNAVSGIGMLHPAHARSERWHPHIHVIVDAPGGLDIEQITKDWKQLTDGWGHVALRPAAPDDGRPKPGDPGDTDNATKYIAHSEDWSPPHADLNPERFAVLRDALAGKHLIVSWGFGERGKHRRDADAYAEVLTCRPALQPARQRSTRTDVRPEAQLIRRVFGCLLTRRRKGSERRATKRHKYKSQRYRRHEQRSGQIHSP